MGNPGSAAGFVGSVFYLQDPSSVEDAESFTDGASRLSDDVTVLLTVLYSSGDRAVVLSVDPVVLLLKDSLPVTNETIVCQLINFIRWLVSPRKVSQICKINICYLEFLKIFDTLKCCDEKLIKFRSDNEAITTLRRSLYYTGSRLQRVRLLRASG